MIYIPATFEYGIIIRKDALLDIRKNREDLIEILSGINLIGEDEKLLSFGPVFGGDTMDSVRAELLKFGLNYVDDFIDIDFLLPDWLAVGVSFVNRR